MKAKKEPELFRMVRQGYDPDEVLDCFLSVIELIRTLQVQSKKEKEVIYQDFLRAKVAVEEGRECAKKLEKELRQTREENERLRIACGLPQERPPADEAAVALPPPPMEAEAALPPPPMEEAATTLPPPQAREEQC